MTRHVLVSAVGLAPQVITETLYYFWCYASPVIPVTEVFALTTQKGKQQIQDVQMQRAVRMLSQQYALPRITFDEDHVHVLYDEAGTPLEDISTTQDNQAVADQIFQFVRSITQSADTHVHASIAGGRKTMGVYLALAMQFYGRPGDTLSHVLVPPELESTRYFFFPPPEGGICLPDGRQLSREAARVELASIPLLFLRDKIPLLREHAETRYTDLVRLVQEEYDALQELPILHIDRVSKSLRVHETAIRLTPLEFALYLYFAQKRLNGCADDDCPGCQECSIAAEDIRGGALQDVLREILGQLGAHDPRYQLVGWEGTGETYLRFNETRSKVNERIKKGFPSFVPLRLYRIERLDAFPGRGNARYAIPLTKQRIHIL